VKLHTGLGASVFTSGYPGARTPAAAGASPQGPTTIGQKSFGIVTGGSGGMTSCYAVISGGVISLGLLIFIWYSLPR
jgi:hypothetical protein